MELGNMVFGNSRGEYQISRSAGFEDILFRLFDILEPDNSGYGADFENDTFSVMRYWWGDCTCGFDAPEHTNDCPDCYKNKRWLSDSAECTCGGNKRFEDYCKAEEEFIGFHDEMCYQMDYEKIKHYEYFGNNHDAWIEKHIKPLYEKHGFDTKSKKWYIGYALKCDCGYDERIEEWERVHRHKDDCMLVRPNFLYKPTGFSISWYKYPLRDSYSNEKFDHAKLNKIIDGCIASLDKTNQVGDITNQERK